jgi:hypothetical protein
MKQLFATLAVVVGVVLVAVTMGVLFLTWVSMALLSPF